MSAENLRVAWLEDEGGKRIVLPPNFTVGRAPANALFINDPQQRVSSYHARVERDGRGRYFVEDRHSTNGTFVNERKVTRQELCDGDRLRFGGRATFIFRRPDPTTRAPADVTQTDVTTRHYEERQYWFLIGDIKGSSRLARSLDGLVLARLVTEWAARCRQLAEKHGGLMANRTGDGWLLLWTDEHHAVDGVAATLQEFRRMQQEAEPSFRVLVHRGRATISGGVRPGEDNVLSADLHQAFRMEKIAARLGQDIVASEAAASLLGKVLPCRPLPGEFELPGFLGMHQFFSVA